MIELILDVIPKEWDLGDTEKLIIFMLLLKSYVQLNSKWFMKWIKILADTDNYFFA